MRAKDLKVIVDHIVEKLGEDAPIVMFKGEDKCDPAFYMAFKNISESPKPMIVEDGCVIVPGVKSKL